MTPLEPIHAPGQHVMGPPLSPAMRVGDLLFVSGIPGYADDGTLAVGDFPAQMRQTLRNVGGILAAAGAGWDRVAKVNVFLTRREDVAEMNRQYAALFPDGCYPARTTAIVVALPHPDFLLEIECVAVLA